MVERFELANGLRVLIKEMHHAPVASFWVWYRVGSRNETPGITGISHWVEHMLFKGTDAFPKGALDREISKRGGMLNGMTWMDFTTYFETLPVDEIDLAFQIEADRMVNALFDANEVKAERGVIISERQGNENRPTFILDEEVQAAAFRVHPYHHETIGNMCDLETISRQQLWDFYRAYYGPHNAIAVLVGDVDAVEARARIEAVFGDIPGQEPPAPMTQEEPAQKGPRRVVVQGDGSTSYLEVCFHAPAASDPDFVTLRVLNAILAGANSTSLFSGGSGSNKSSRLYKALVETELAATVLGSVTPTIDPFLYSVSATVRAGHTPAEVEAALDNELERVMTEPISEEELAKAAKQVRAHFAYSSESVTSQGYWLGFSEIVADYTWFETFLDQVAQVSVEDVQELAQRILVNRNRTTGVYVPREAERGE